MKPISLAFFFLIIFGAVVFALVYVLWKDFVEAYPAIFTIALVITIVIGMGGMMYDLIFNTSNEQQKLY